MKESYEQSLNKRKIQLLTLKGEGKFIGLGGPNLDIYTNVVRNAGFTDITIYENDRKVFLQQFLSLPQGVKLVYGDIREHLNEDAFYDLDFCCSISGLMGGFLEEIVKIPKFCMTLCARPRGIRHTINEVHEYLKLPSYTYKDSMTMITFFKH